jgi:phage baseplate assembly protein W
VKWGSHAADSGAAEAGAGILERLIRAKSRDPQSLDDIRHIVADLLSTPAGEKMVPKAFRELWDVIAKEDA